jgi:hypothetical protein
MVEVLTSILARLAALGALRAGLPPLPATGASTTPATIAVGLHRVVDHAVLIV